MKFFGLNIGKEKGLEVKEGYQSFSTPFMNVGEGNLSLPYVNARQQVNGYIRFGVDNLYPQLINQLYYTSPLHSAIVDFKVNATIGGGYELKVDKTASAMEKVGVYSFEKRIKLDRVLEALTKDDVMHNRVYFKLRFNESGDLIDVKHIGAEKVRRDQFGTAYFLCYDWSSQIEIETIYPYNPRIFQKECLYVYEKQCVGQDVYSLPSYTSAFNWAFLDGEMSYLQKSNILNSIFPSFAILFPKKPQSEEEKNAIRKTVEQGKGARNGGKTLAFFANAKDQLPEIQAIPTNANDNLFQSTTESIDSKICQAHTIDPILMGIRVSGKLGSGSDIKQSYIIFEKNVIIPQKTRIERIVNELFKIGKVKAEFSLKSYAIINDVITERDEKTQKLVDSINSLPQNIQATVLGKMTDSEIRSLVGLETDENTQTQTPA
jgi:hypothetical protein